MQSDMCFTIDDALREVTKALGGAKVVGIRLRPDFNKDVEAAGRWWLDCINPERAQKASLEQVMVVLRWAHDAGCHVGMDFIARDCGYREPQPITPEDEDDELKREYVSAVKLLAKITERQERLSVRRV